MRASTERRPTLRRRRAGLGARAARLLSRSTSDGSFIPEIDGLRFIPILAVIFHHVIATWLIESKRYGLMELPQDWDSKVKGISPWFALAAQANFGVPLFFVISGFVLALPFLRPVLGNSPPPKLRNYYLRRLTRLEPPYLLALAIAFCSLIVVDGKPLWLFVPHLLASAFYVHGTVYGTASWVLGIAWSLEVEAQFYLLMPLLARVIFLRGSAARRALVITLTVTFSLLSQCVFDPGYAGSFAALGLPNFLQYFLAGFLLADLYLGRPPTSTTPRGSGFLWDLLGSAASVGLLAVLIGRPKLALAGLGYPWNGGSLAFLLPWLIVAIYSGALFGRSMRWVVTRRWVVVVGGMCYTTYLYHLLAIGWAYPRLSTWISGRFSPHLESLLFFLLLLIPIYALSAVLFVLVEKPFMVWKPWRRRIAPAGA